MYYIVLLRWQRISSFILFIFLSLPCRLERVAHFQARWLSQMVMSLPSCILYETATISFFCRRKSRYSRWKDDKRNGKLGKNGRYKCSIGKSQKGTEPDVRKGKRFKPACRTSCECSMDTIVIGLRSSWVLMVMKLVKSYWYWKSS